MDSRRMVALVNELGAVKSRQDAGAAVALQHETMRLVVPPMGALVIGREANRQALSGFFQAFPDYHVVLEGNALAGHDLVAWGTVTMTLATDRYGVAPTGRSASFPAFFRFGFADDLIASEYFLWDLAEACAQWGVSTDAVRVGLFGAANEARAA